MDIFLDSFFSTVIIFKLPFLPGTGELVFFTKLYFGVDNYDKLVFSALAGSVAGELLNYMIGIYILVLGRRSSKFVLTEEKYQKYSKIFNRHFTFLLPFTWINFGAFLTVGAGFFRTNIYLTLLLIAIGKYGYYIAVLMDELPTP